MKSSNLKGLDSRIMFLREEIRKRVPCSSNNDINEKVTEFKSKFKSRWEKACRIEANFLKTNTAWLKTPLLFKYSSETKRGRPEVSFEESSERSKRQKTELLRKSTSVAELTYAAEMGLRASGHLDAAKLMRDVAKVPDHAEKCRKALRDSIEPVSMTGDEALAMIIEADLSRFQYEVIRSKAPKIFPSYKVIQESKKKCYPHPENMSISETVSYTNLQSLLNLTVNRLVTVQESVIRTLRPEELKTITLYSKWGFDGSSGHSSYKQAFHGLDADDSSVFITCVVPLRLVSGEKIIWQNPRPSSTRYCRPLKIEFVKESAAVSTAEKRRVDSEIKELLPSFVKLGENTFNVVHKLLFTMIDGKVCNAITENTSTQKCYICKATSKDFNSIDVMIKRPVKTDNLQFGLSVLHGWIRFFECLLHLAYKLEIKQWQARKDEHKKIVDEKKKQIQKQFRERLGLIVDKPKPGFGNSNDGNTARRFFENAEISADITKVDVILIKKIHIILIVVASGHEVDCAKFREFAHETARYFVSLYPWYYMPTTVHKYLIHGNEIISKALLPIGQLSEEAQEARNKDFKNYREHHSRKNSRKNTNQDIFNLFLLSSDPVLTSLQRVPKKKIQSLPQEAINLLKSPNISVQTVTDIVNESDQDE